MDDASFQAQVLLPPNQVTGPAQCQGQEEKDLTSSGKAMSRNPWTALICLTLTAISRLNSSFFFSFLFLGPHLQHMEVPRLGAESELQLLACTASHGDADP